MVLTREQEDAILADYEAGMAGYQIAEKHGRAIATVFRVVKRRGKLGRRRGRTGRVSKLEAHLNALARDYESGMTTAQLSERYGASAGHIARFLIERGVHIRHAVAWRPTSSEQWLHMVAEYQAGMTPIAEIARHAGCSEKRFRELLSEQDLIGKRKRQARGRFGPDEQAQMAWQYTHGESLAQIARSFHTNWSTVRLILLRNKVAMRPAGRARRVLSADQVAEASQCWVGGESQESIAHRFGVDQTTVSHALRVLPAELARTARRASRQRHGMWKGGRVRDANGYVKVLLEPSDPMVVMAKSNGYVYEHRLVLARHLGRPLLPNENPHHRNAVRDDNRLENLELWTTSQPHGARVADKLAWAREIVRLYGHLEHDPVLA